MKVIIWSNIVLGALVTIFGNSLMINELTLCGRVCKILPTKAALAMTIPING